MTDAEKALERAALEATRHTHYGPGPHCTCGQRERCAATDRALDLARKVGRLEQAEAFVETFRQWGGFGAVKMRIAEERDRLRRELDEATRG